MGIVIIVENLNEIIYLMQYELNHKIIHGTFNLIKKYKQQNKNNERINAGNMEQTSTDYQRPMQC